MSVLSWSTCVALHGGTTIVRSPRCLGTTTVRTPGAMSAWATGSATAPPLAPPLDFEPPHALTPTVSKAANPNASTRRAPVPIPSIPAPLFLRAPPPRGAVPRQVTQHHL